MFKPVSRQYRIVMNRRSKTKSQNGILNITFCIVYTAMAFLNWLSSFYLQLHVLTSVLKTLFQKSTKTALETGRTFCTLLADSELRLQLHDAQTEEEFRKLLHERTKTLMREQSVPENRKSHEVLSSCPFQEDENEVSFLSFFCLILF